MNTAKHLDFSACFEKRISRFEVDLSNSTLIEVLQSYQTSKQMNSTKYTLSHVMYNLREIERAYNQTLVPTDVTDIFYKCFIQYLFNVKHLEYSTISNYCGVLRTVLTWGCKHGCKVSSTFDEYKVPKHEPRKISLTADDISHIAHFDVSTITKKPNQRRILEQVRDTFVLQANLFQRFSDMRHLSKDNFRNNIYSCIQQKTSNRAVVDINRYSFTPKLTFKILEKYNYECPYKGNINNFNRHLHFLLSHIGGSFDEDITFEEKQNGEIVKITKKKWEIISSHCARRSSITHAVQNAKTETEVRRCSGHVNHQDAFQRYIVFNDFD